MHTVVSERERRSIELLTALPVTVTDILTAKLAANLAVAVTMLLPLFAIDAVVIPLGITAGPLYICAAFLLLVSTLAASIGVSLVLALVARDFRTANNLNGLFVLPAMLLTGLCITLVPGLWRFVVLSALMLLMGGIAAWIALRWADLRALSGVNGSPATLDGLVIARPELADFPDLPSPITIGGG